MSRLPSVWWRMWRSGNNGFRRIAIEQPIRGASVLLVLFGVWLFLGLLFMSVLIYLNQDTFISVKARLVESLLALFFYTLFFMVTISDTVLTWGALFRSEAAKFHAQLPLTERDLYWGASLEGGMWSSWAVFVLMVPLMGALVLDEIYTRGYYHTVSKHLLEVGLMTLGVVAALGSFVLCCTSAGALGSMVLARIIPLLRRGLRGILIVAVLALAVGVFFVLGSFAHRDEPLGFMNEIVGKLRFTENPYLPPWWAQQALSAALTERWWDWSYFIALLASTACFLSLIGEWVAGRRLRRDLDALTGRPDERTAARSRPWRLLPVLPADLSLLAVKDVRLFLRDPAQVLQFMMFFGLLGFYLLLLPRIGKSFMFDSWWRPAVSLLNLTAVTMALATFTGRFVYPLLSLEGKRLWILVLAPWPRTRVVTAKFVFALLIGMPVSIGLVVLSGTMLELSGWMVLYQAFTIACMAVGFSAGALGLGARLADYNEDNPAKLVAGYGGTVNLMMSLVFTGLLMAGAAIPVISGWHSDWKWALGLGWTVTITTLWTWAFMRMAWYWFGRDV